MHLFPLSPLSSIITRRQPVDYAALRDTVLGCGTVSGLTLYKNIGRMDVIFADPASAHTAYMTLHHKILSGHKITVLLEDVRPRFDVKNVNHPLVRRRS